MLIYLNPVALASLFVICDIPLFCFFFEFRQSRRTDEERKENNNTSKPGQEGSKPDKESSQSTRRRQGLRSNRLQSNHRWQGQRYQTPKPERTRIQQIQHSEESTNDKQRFSSNLHIIYPLRNKDCVQKRNRVSNRMRWVRTR